VSRVVAYTFFPKKKKKKKAPPPPPPGGSGRETGVPGSPNGRY